MAVDRAGFMERLAALLGAALGEGAFAPRVRVVCVRCTAVLWSSG